MFVDFCLELFSGRDWVLTVWDIYMDNLSWRLQTPGKGALQMVLAIQLICSINSTKLFDLFAKQQHRSVRFWSTQLSHIYQRTTLVVLALPKILQQRKTFQSSPFNHKKADPIKAVENFQESVIFIQYPASSSIQVDRFLLSSSSSRSEKPLSRLIGKVYIFKASFRTWAFPHPRSLSL